MLSLLSTISVCAVEIDQSTKSHPVIDQVFAKYEKAFNAGDAKAIGLLWKTDGEFIDPLGNRILGREAIEKLFQEFFSRSPGKKLLLKVLSLKEQEEGSVVVAEVVPQLIPPPPGEVGLNKATIVLVRSGESWLIEGIKENTHMPPSYEHLKDLQWTVGSWTSREPSSETSGKSDQIDINFNCDWTANKSFLRRMFTSRLQQLEFQGTEIIGWDPKDKIIRSWTFESTGGFTESTWKPDGDKWVIEMKGVLANGDTVSSTTTVTKIDENTLAFRTQKRKRADKSMPDIDKQTLHRVASSQEKP
jgi:uncharacterized protein (TIGR02246 family)